MVSYNNMSWLCRTLHSAGVWRGGSSFFLGVLRQFSCVPRSCKICLALSLALTGSPNSDVPITGANLSLPCWLHPQAQSIKFALKTNKGRLHSQASYIKPILWFQAGSAMSSWQIYRVFTRFPPQPEPQLTLVSAQLTRLHQAPGSELAGGLLYGYRCHSAAGLGWTFGYGNLQPSQQGSAKG